MLPAVTVATKTDGQHHQQPIRNSFKSFSISASSKIKFTSTYDSNAMPNTTFGFVATRIAANLDQTCRNKNNSDNRYRVLEKCFTSALVRLTLFTFSN
jgi:hypothetical protein